MTDHDALLRAIGENPADDTPRLVFADWLDENADVLPDPAGVRARAAFIRDDIAVSRLDEFAPERLRWELIEKPRRDGDGWVQRLPWVTELLNGPLLRRGFPWGIRLNPRQFLTHADRLFAQVPVTTLAFASNDGATDELFRSPYFARLRGLRVHRTHLPERVAARLADAPVLEELNASDNGLSADAVGALLRSPLFPRLTRLDLGGVTGVAGVVRAIADFAGPNCLRDLSLARTGLTGEHVRRLLTTDAVAGVERLRLTGNRSGTLALHEAIARLPLDRLYDLDLSETASGPAGLRVLSTSLTLSRLKRLAYRQNGVTAALVAELATCHEVSTLRVLDLTSNAIGNTGVSTIARSPHFAGLLVLNLSYCMVGDEGILALLESPLAAGLVLLDLTGSPASAETKELLKAKMGDRVRL
ncbi:TIGR02996 domain-containing protein [Gemmata sp. G18]|uniref:TIGR02996 domain-containing protein n=1 Tax=Gemmata palustris TaxID=2822762 RepID=A0ABS5C120_9BACT|nr:TIGR02996 domain-containing protein [Gemmata palustris]MBP3959684.1 TIGR02996 domain-containing protein [Gemmata palustris]